MRRAVAFTLARRFDSVFLAVHWNHPCLTIPAAWAATYNLEDTEFIDEPAVTAWFYRILPTYGFSGRCLWGAKPFKHEPLQTRCCCKLCAEPSQQSVALYRYGRNSDFTHAAVLLDLRFHLFPGSYAYEIESSYRNFWIGLIILRHLCTGADDKRFVVYQIVKFPADLCCQYACCIFSIIIFYTKRKNPSFFQRKIKKFFSYENWEKQAILWYIILSKFIIKMKDDGGGNG